MAKNSNRRKRKIGWKQIICGIVAGIVLIVCIGGISSCFRDDGTKTLGSGIFSRGALDENGEYVETNKSLYTKEAFACKGLRVVPDFESQLTYDVYYYDYDERLIEAKLGLDGVYDEDYPQAMYARVVIHPDAASESDDYEISWYDIRSIANKLDVIVDKDQTWKYGNCSNLYDEEKSTRDKSFQAYLNVGDVLETVDNNHAKLSEVYTVGEYTKYDLYLRRTLQDKAHTMGVFFMDDTNVLVSYEHYSLADLEAGEWCCMTFEVPKDVEGDISFQLRLPIDSECILYGYN